MALGVLSSDRVIIASRGEVADVYPLYSASPQSASTPVSCQSSRVSIAKRANVALTVMSHSGGAAHREGLFALTQCLVVYQFVTHFLVQSRS